MLRRSPAKLHPAEPRPAAPAVVSWDGSPPSLPEEPPMNRYAQLLPALALLAGGQALPALAAGAGAGAATVTVAGRGEVRGLPDEASVTLGVSARAATAAAARGHVNQV